LSPRNYNLFPIFIPLWNNSPIVGWGLIIKASRSYSDTPHLSGLLWTSDQSVAETYTWQHTTLTRDILTPAGFEPAIPARQRPQANVLDCLATGIGNLFPMPKKTLGFHRFEGCNEIGIRLKWCLIMKDKNLRKAGKGKLVLRCDKLLICGGEYGKMRE
jgi:hypothetical protein